MNVEEVREYCLQKPYCTESMPFDEWTLVFKVGDKMFALLSLEGSSALNLKCNPERAIELREHYPEAIFPGYHMNKKHWNTVLLGEILQDEMIRNMIDHSYDLVFDKLPKKVKEELKKL